MIWIRGTVRQRKRSEKEKIGEPVWAKGIWKPSCIWCLMLSVLFFSLYSYFTKSNKYQSICWIYSTINRTLVKICDFILKLKSDQTVSRVEMLHQQRVLRTIDCKQAVKQNMMPTLWVNSSFKLRSGMRTCVLFWYCTIGQ